MLTPLGCDSRKIKVDGLPDRGALACEYQIGSLALIARIKKLAGGIDRESVGIIVASIEKETQE